MSGIRTHLRRVESLLQSANDRLSEITKEVEGGIKEKPQSAPALDANGEPLVANESIMRYGTDPSGNFLHLFLGLDNSGHVLRMNLRSPEQSFRTWNKPHSYIAVGRIDPCITAALRTAFKQEGDC